MCKTDLKILHHGNLNYLFYLEADLRRAWSLFSHALFCRFHFNSVCGIFKITNFQNSNTKVGKNWSLFSTKIAFSILTILFVRLFLEFGDLFSVQTLLNWYLLLERSNFKLYEVFFDVHNIYSRKEPRVVESHRLFWR